MPKQPDTPFHVGEKPTLADLIRQALRSDRLQLHTNLPATVLAFNPAPPVPTVTVQVDLIRALIDPTGTVDVPKAIPPIGEVPVEFFRGGGFRISALLKPGDTGDLWVTERSIDQWRELGGPIDPKSGRTHALRDCFFRPGIHPKTNPATSTAGGTGFKIEKEDGTASIEIFATGEIKLSSALAVSMLTGAALGPFLLALHTALTVWVPVPMDGGAALKAALAAFLALTPPGP